MNSTVRGFALACGFAVVLSSFASAAPVRSDAVALDAAPGLRAFGYTLVPTTPLEQYTPDLFVGPYFNFTLTNTGDQTDTFRMIVSNLTDPNFFGQVCIEAVCFPDSALVTLNPSESKTVGVNLVPFAEGSCTADFDLNSVGNPQLTSFYQVTLWAGQGLGSPRISGPAAFSLEQNAPNPVVNRTRIAFSLVHPADVRLDVFDVAGRLVRSLVRGPRAAGSHDVTWNRAADDGSRLASGVYLVRLATADGVVAKRMTIVD